MYRSTFPTWVADSSDRGLLNWCHDRAWAHVIRIFEAVPGVSFVDQPPTRELHVGVRYRLRVKKHDIEGHVSTYLTQGALDFLEQESATVEGLEEVRLIAGYRWDAELREVGAAVISLRDGQQHIVWMHELDEPAEVVGAIPTPILPPAEPRKPEIGMASNDERAERTEDE